MRSSLQSVIVSSFVAFILVACGGTRADPESVAEPESQPATDASADGAPAERPVLTAEQCEASGGAVVGDIGDGAVHRADYVCASGAKPTGSIQAPEGGPIGVEGAVCCPR